MSHFEFNTSSEKALYTYKRHPLEQDVDPRSFQILKKDQSEAYEPVGEYRVLDDKEDPDLSEKKVMNLVAAMNGRENFIHLGEGTGTRMLFNPIPRQDESEKSKVIFYTLAENSGVSVENAILTLEEDLVGIEKIEEFI